MDIYIIRKCRVELREFTRADGSKYKLPVMTKEDIHSYVVKELLNSWQREKIQNELEEFYTNEEDKK